jgi:hypothetical protein
VVAIRGWGGIKLGKGLLEHRMVRCTRARCPAVNYPTRGSRAVVSEKPYTGWKFAHWSGACKGKRPRCVVHVAREHPTASGERHLHVSATFTPVAAGITRGHPIPFGTTGIVRRNWRMQVNSVTPSVPLSPAPPSEAEYFDANVTVTYAGSGTATPEQDLTWRLSAENHTTYTIGSNPCPYPGPQPTLPLYNLVYSGQSVSGYVCWQIAASDVGGLELYFGSGDLDYPGTTWFALR